VAKEAINFDFLNLRSLYYEKIDLSKGRLKISFRDGYYFSDDLTMLLMFVRPVRSAQDLAFCKSLMGKVNSTIADVQREFREQEEEHPLEIKVGLTGGYPIALAYDRLLKKDGALTIITTFIGIMVLFIIGFRRIFAPLYASVPLIVGIIWTMGFTYLTIGSINFFTGASAAVLIGLGIDISIHLYNRYLEETQLRRSLMTAFEKTMSETGIGIFSAMVTTVVAFYATLASDFKGLSQLGFICGSGMIIIFIATFFILPAMISVGVRSKLLRDRRRSMSNFGLDRMTRWITKHYRIVIIACLGMTLLSIFLITRINIEQDFLNLRPKGIPEMDLQDSIMQKLGSPMIYTMIVGESATEKGILKLSNEISKKLETLVDQDYVVSYRSLSMILPPEEEQMRNINWLREQKKTDPAAFDMERIKETLIDSLVRNGFRVEGYGKIVDFLNSALSLEKPLTLSEVQNSGLRNIIERFISVNSEGYSQVAYVYPENERPGKDVLGTIMREVNGIDKSVQVIGVKILGAELKRIIKRGVLISSIVALIAVVILLFLHFRKPYYVLLAIIPLLMGVVWGFGIMVLLGFSFNIISITVLPLIFGIGIDNGIHIVNRFLFEKENLRHIFHHTGRALILTSATTIMGFGSLIFADYPGLVGVGAVATFGVGATLLSAIIFLPALLTALYHREQK
jgi:predicted RND superfamily exporter protein